MIGCCSWMRAASLRRGLHRTVCGQRIFNGFFRRTARRRTIERYAHLATFEEIEQNDFNLNIPRYVATFEAEPEVDLTAVNKEIMELDAQLTTASAEIARYLKELGLHG